MNTPPSSMVLSHPAHPQPELTEPCVTPQSSAPARRNRHASANSAATSTRAAAGPARTATPPVDRLPSGLVVSGPSSRRSHAARTVSTSSTNAPPAVSDCSTRSSVRAAAASPGGSGSRSPARPATSRSCSPSCWSSCRDDRLVALPRAHATFGDPIKSSATTGERHATITGQSTTLDNIPVTVLARADRQQQRRLRSTSGGYARHHPLLLLD